MANRERRQPDDARGRGPGRRIQTLLHLPLRELLLNGVLDNRGMLLVAATYGVLWQAGLSRVVWDQLAQRRVRAGPRARHVRGRLPRAACRRWPGSRSCSSSIVGLLLLVRVLSMIWSGVRLYDFRLSRVGDDLRTEYGLLTRVTATIPLRRVQTLTIREAPLQRLVQRMSVRVETAGGTRHAAEGAGPSNRASGWRRSSGAPPCPLSCARCFPASILTRSSGAAASARVSPGVEAGDDRRPRDHGAAGRSVRLARARRAAVHAGVDEPRGMEAGAAHAVGR